MITVYDLIYFAPVSISIILFFILKNILSHSYLLKVIPFCTKTPLIILLIVTIFFLTFEYYIFGRSSLMVIYDEGDSFFPYYKLIAENDHKNIFFELSGGLNKNAITFDNKLISLQTNVLKLINPFYGYLTLKIFNAFIIVVGFWFLTKKNIKYTFVLSSIYYASFPYISTISLVHLAGYSAIPFSLFLVFLYKPIHSYKNLILFFYFCFISTSASFPHSILAHIAAIFAFPFILNYSKLKQNITLALIWGIVFSSICLVNNFPMIEYIINNKELIYRTSVDTKFSLLHLLTVPFYETFSKLRGPFIFLLGFLFCFISFIFNKKYIKNIIFVIPLFFYFFIKLISQLDFFNFIQTIRAEQVMLCLPIIILYALYYIYININFQLLLNKKLLTNCFTFATIFFVIDYKFNHLLDWFGQGSFISNYIISDNLKTFLIKNKILLKGSENQLVNFRTAVIPTKITTGFSWFNQISSFDGYSNFFSKERSEKWLSAFPEGNHNEQFITKRYHFKLKNKNNNYLSDIGSINFLRQNGVRYYFSKVKLHDDFLVLKHNQILFENNNSFLNIQKSNINRNFSKVDFFVYEDKNYSPIFRVLDDKNNILCFKNIKIYSLSSSLKVDLKSCLIGHNNPGKKLVMSFPNFHKIEIQIEEHKKTVENNKNLEFVINLGSFSKELYIKPIY